MEAILHENFLSFELLVFDSWDFVLLDFVGSITLKLVIRELMFDDVVPSSEYSESLICLGFCGELLL